MADYYEHTQSLVTPENLRKQLEMQNFWGNSASLARLSISTLTLRNFKLNRQNRLSSSSQTQCEIADKVTIGHLNTLLTVPELSDLSTRPDQHYDYFRKKQPEQLALVPFTHLSEIRFSSYEQKQRYMVCQKRPDTLIPISIITASEIDNFYF